MASLGFPWHLINHFDDAAACHAAMHDGGAVLDWGSEGISGEDAKWIASALADPTVCVIQQQSLHCHSPCTRFPRSRCIHFGACTVLCHEEFCDLYPLGNRFLATSSRWF
jgi:hypothetical protein